MRNIWAVTRQTFIECVRARVLLTFLVVLGASVLAIALIAQGDGSLKGRIQTFLYYTTLLTQVLLGMATVFLATGIIANDIRRKTIFIVASKPLCRWQYVVGRWLGIVCLNAALLALAMAAIYGLAYYLRAQPTAIERRVRAGRLDPSALGRDMDRLAVNSDIFTARRSHHPDPINLDRFVAEKLQARVRAEGLDNIILQRIRKELQQEIASESGAAVDEEEVRRRARHEGTRGAVLARIAQDIRNSELGDLMLLQPGQGLRIVFSGLKLPVGFDEPIKLQYRLRPMTNPESRTLISFWQFHHPREIIEPVTQTDSTDAASFFLLKPLAVGEDGRLVVDYVNDPRNPTAVKLNLEDFVLMYRAGSFEANFVRAGVLMLLWLMFLAGVGILWGSILSFPVACLATLMVFVLGWMSGFVLDATMIYPHIQQDVSFFQYFSHYLAKGVYLLLPDFSGTSPTDSLIDGSYIPYGRLLQESLLAVRGSDGVGRPSGIDIQTGVGLRTWIFLALSCLLFRRRELARVQVQ